MAIDLATDSVVREFFQDLGNQGGVAMDAANFVTIKQDMALPITLVCVIFTEKKVNLRYRQMDDRDGERRLHHCGAIASAPDLDQKQAQERGSANSADDCSLCWRR